LNAVNRNVCFSPDWTSAGPLFPRLCPRSWGFALNSLLVCFSDAGIALGQVAVLRPTAQDPEASIGSVIHLGRSAPLFASSKMFLRRFPPREGGKLFMPAAFLYPLPCKDLRCPTPLSRFSIFQPARAVAFKWRASRAAGFVFLWFTVGNVFARFT